MSNEVVLRADRNPIVEKLDTFFKISERDSSISKELYAGLSVFLISVCALFMQIQIIAEAYSDNIPYCGIYLGATIVSFIGTILIGLLCNKPLVQTASLSMSTLMISMLNSNAALSYENILAVTFVAAIVYTLVSLVPFIKEKMYSLIPAPIKKVLPAAMGAYVIMVALEKMQIAEGGKLLSLADDNLGGASIAPYVRLCVVVGILAVFLLIWNIKRNADTPVFTTLYVSTLIFFLIASVVGGIQFSYVFSQNRIWIGVNPDKLGEMYTISTGLKELAVGKLFSAGFDFSNYTVAGGNVAVLFIKGILTFWLMGMLETDASSRGAYECGEITADEKDYGKLFVINGISNVLAAIFGVAPTSLAKSSAASTIDGGRTGLSSIVCAVGYLIAMFTWIPFVLLATHTASVPEYGHAGFVFPNVTQASFQIVDGIMFVIGLRMLMSLKKFAEDKVSDMLTAALVIAVTFGTQNILYGVCVGVVCHAILTLLSFSKKEIIQNGYLQYIMAIFSAIILVGAAMSSQITGEMVNSNDVISEVADNAGADQSASVSDLSTSPEDNYASFEFDSTTGDYQFEATEDVDYYTVWVYASMEDGSLASEYSVASARITDKGDISGNLDVSGLSYGKYYATLNGFAESSSKEPIIIGFGVSGKLTAPEFTYTADGNELTVSLYDEILTLYNDSEMFTDIAINIYDTDGNIVLNDTLTTEDLVGQQMGPFMNYTCEKTITVEDGEYLLSMTATGDGEYATPSDESEQLAISISADSSNEGHTSGVSEEE